MINQKQEKYPNYPPFDNQITFYQSSTLRLNPTGSQKYAKICPKCQFPIQIRIHIKPCQHYLCYQCYSYNKNQCAFCGSVACQVVQIGDKEKIYSCDIECFKVFQNQEMLKKHIEEHSKIKINGKVTL